MTPVEIQRHLVAFNVLHGGLGDYGTRADGVRDDDGSIGPRTKDALSAAAAIFGLTGPTWVEKTVARVEAEIRGWPSRLTVQVGMRALAVALREWCAGVKEEPPGSNTGPRIREYLAGCIRDGKPLPLASGDWCAASASWCAARAATDEGDRIPHGYRASGIELQRDLERAKAWRSASDARSGRYRPAPGDLVILDRSTPGRPETAWQRHVCRVVALRGETLWTLGGNEANAWRLTARKLSDAKLLGFGEYPRYAWSHADERRVAELCPGTAAKMVSEPICT